MGNQAWYMEMNESYAIIEFVKKKIHDVLLMRVQMYHIIKMIPNRIFFTKLFGY